MSRELAISYGRICTLEERWTFDGGGVDVSSQWNLASASMPVNTFLDVVVSSLRLLWSTSDSGLAETRKTQMS
ncbi:hypothetical protein R3I94_007566 [Phoxinus phoxinus]